MIKVWALPLDCPGRNDPNTVFIGRFGCQHLIDYFDNEISISEKILRYLPNFRGIEVSWQFDSVDDAIALFNKHADTHQVVLDKLMSGQVDFSIMSDDDFVPGKIKWQKMT